MRIPEEIHEASVRPRTGYASGGGAPGPGLEGEGWPAGGPLDGDSGAGGGTSIRRKNLG